MDIITSKGNKIFRFVKSLLLKKERVLSSCYSIEGVKSVLEAFDYSDDIRLLALSEEQFLKNPVLHQKAKEKNVDCFVFSDDLIAQMSDTKTPSGAIAVIGFSSSKPQIKKGLYIYLDHINDPGNAGTIIRTADACGASAVFFSPDSVDIYNPKLIRSTMGSFFHIPVYENVSSDIITEAAKNDFSVIGGALCKDSIDYMDVEMKENTLIIIGNESNGISESVMPLIKTKAIIPIVGKAESLNASVASALFMYRWLDLNS